MATDVKIIHVRVNATKPNNDPNNPTNAPADTLADLRDKVLAKIADDSDGQTDLSGGFEIVKVIPLPNNGYEVWLTN